MNKYFIVLLFAVVFQGCSGMSTPYSADAEKTVAGRAVTDSTDNCNLKR